MTAPDRARLRDKVGFCRRLGAEGMDGISALNLLDDLDGALDALDEAEKERDAAQTAHGELFGTFTETEARLDEAERLIARADRFLRNGSGYREEIASWLAAAREALARIGAGE